MRIISSSLAPAAIGPYSQGIIVGNLLFTAGQIPLVPESMEMVTGSIEAQTERVLANLDAMLAAADAALYKAKHAGRNRVLWADEEKATAPSSLLDANHRG